MKGKITANQFFILLFLSSVYYISTIGSESLKDNFSDSLISVLASGVIGVLLSLPLINLHGKGMDLKSSIRRCFGGLSTTVLVLYAAYFLLGDIAILSLMEGVLAGTVFPTIPSTLIGAMAVLVAIYGAMKGVEAVARAGLVIFVITVIGSLAIFIGALPLFRFENREVFMFNGPGDAINNTLVIFARSTFLPQSVMLLSSVQGKLAKKNIWWNTGVALMGITVFIIIIHCLGSFADTQLFPVYTLSSVSQLMPIQRMDIVFSAVWLMGLSLRLSCDFLAIKNCLKPMHSKKYGWAVLGTAGLLVLSVSQILKSGDYLGKMSAAYIYLGIPAVILGFGIPLYIKIKLGKEGAK